MPEGAFRSRVLRQPAIRSAAQARAIGGLPRPSARYAPRRPSRASELAPEQHDSPALARQRADRLAENAELLLAFYSGLRGQVVSALFRAELLPGFPIRRLLDFNDVIERVGPSELVERKVAYRLEHEGTRAADGLTLGRLEQAQIRLLQDILNIAGLDHSDDPARQCLTVAGKGLHTQFARGPLRVVTVNQLLAPPRLNLISVASS